MEVHLADSRPKRNALTVAVVWVLATIASLPFLLKWHAPTLAESAGLPIAVGWLIVCGVCYGIYHLEARRLPSRWAVIVTLFIIILTATTNNLHHNLVDYSRDAFPGVANTSWQAGLEDAVIQWSRFDVPHTYRFLPNSIVRWMQLAGLDFADARDFYRDLVGLLLFYAIYCFARLYTGVCGALVAIILVGLVTPISYEHYVGQLTDPLSHLSFVLAFIFLATGNFPLLLSTLLIGSLAKETVLALAGYYVLFCRGDSGYNAKAPTILFTTGVIYMAVRWLVLHGPMGYSEISGTTLQHVSRNVGDSRWPLAFVLTAGAFSPILILNWHNTPGQLRRLALYLLPVLFVSSMFFSWLAESRNFMPVVVVLAVVAGYHLEKLAGVEPLTSNQTPPKSR